MLSVLSARLSPFLVAQRSFALPTGGASSASAMASSLKSLEELQACMEGAVAAAQTSRGAARAASTAVAAAAAAAEDLAVKSWAAEEAATEALAAVVAEKNVAVPSSYASGTTADMSASRRQHRRDTAAVAVGGAREAVQAAVDLRPCTSRRLQPRPPPVLSRRQTSWHRPHGRMVAGTLTKCRPCSRGSRQGYRCHRARRSR